MKKYVLGLSLLVCTGIGATPLTKQLKRIGSLLADHAKSEEESWSLLKDLDRRISKIENSLENSATSPIAATTFPDESDEYDVEDVYDETYLSN